MFPYKTDIKPKHFPFVTWLILITNVAIFVYGWYTGTQVEIIQKYGLIARNVTHGLSFGLSWRKHIAVWFTHLFIHASWLHIISNMIYLKVFGDAVEDRLGKFGFVSLYFSGGILAALTQILVYPNSTAALVGASGAISALLGAYVVLFPKARVLVFIPIFFIWVVRQWPAALFIGVWFVLQVFVGMYSLGSGDTVAWWAHIGGFLAGCGIALVLK